MLISDTLRPVYNEKEQARQKEMQNTQFEKKNIIMESNVGAKACAESSKERPDAKWNKGSVPSGQPHPAIPAMYEGKRPKECVCKKQWIEVYENVIQRGGQVPSQLVTLAK